MCLIVFAWRPGHAQPLLIASNRDEFYARPSLPLTEWPDAPGIFAGRDLQAGGTWLGIGPNGRVAALTNIRNPGRPEGSRSRGELPLAYLNSDLTAVDFLQFLSDQCHHYSGFNLLFGNTQQLWHFNSQERRTTALEEGVYGVSNADLNTPWPKLQRAKQALQNGLHAANPQTLLTLLADTTQAADADLPDTGIGLTGERLLSRAFIACSTYGTRASTALIVNADGSRELLERSFGVNGVFLGEVRLSC